MLIQCPECELPLSDKAISCPHCGYPVRPKPSYKPRNSSRRRRLPNGFGQISEIKNRNLRKPFRAMITVGKTETGRPICKPLKPNSYFETYNDAYSALVEYNKNPYDISSDISMQELFNRWFREYQETVSRNHARALERAWGHAAVVHEMKVKEVRGRHLKAALENGPTPIIKVKMKTVFNMMLDYAVEYELVDQNYAKTFDLPKDISASVREAKNGHIAFTDEEMTKIWKHFPEIRLGEIFLIQCYSGWRPEELLEISLENVDLKNHTFTGGMKTTAGKNRIVPIHPLIRSFVDKWYFHSKSIGGKYLFSNEAGIKDDKKLSYEVYLSCFQAMVSTLGLNLDHRPHDCRKHFVTLCKKYHVDEYAIKYMVGHSIRDLTERTYTERSIDWLQEEISKINIV